MPSCIVGCLLSLQKARSSRLKSRRRFSARSALLVAVYVDRGRARWARRPSSGSKSGHETFKRAAGYPTLRRVREIRGKRTVARSRSASLGTANEELDPLQPGPYERRTSGCADRRHCRVQAKGGRRFEEERALSPIYSWRQTFTDDATRIRESAGIKSWSDTLPRRRPPMKVPTIEPDAMMRTNALLCVTTPKALSRL